MAWTRNLERLTMGWKAFTLFATTREDGYLTTFPSPIPHKARAYLELLGGKYQSHGETTLEEGLYPSDEDDLYIGAYADALVLGSIPIAESAFTSQVPKAVQAAGELLPGCRVLIIALHGVVDLFGYAWFEDSRLIRARAGDADHGIFFETGQPLPIEQQLKSFDETTDGGEIVMELCRPFIGCRLDEYDPWDLKMERFRHSKTGWLRNFNKKNTCPIEAAV